MKKRMRWSERACGVNLLKGVSVLLKSTTKSQDSQPSKVTDQGLVHMPIRMLATPLPPKPHECELQPYCARKGRRRARARARLLQLSAGSKSCTMPAIDRGEGLRHVCKEFNSAGTQLNSACWFGVGLRSFSQNCHSEKKFTKLQKKKGTGH